MTVVDLKKLLLVLTLLHKTLLLLSPAVDLTMKKLDLKYLLMTLALTILLGSHVAGAGRGVGVIPS